MQTTLNISYDQSASYVLDELAMHQFWFTSALVFAKIDDGVVDHTHPCLIVSDYTYDHFDMLNRYLKIESFNHVDLYVTLNERDERGDFRIAHYTMSYDAFRHVFTDTAPGKTMTRLSTLRTTPTEREADSYLVQALRGGTVYVLTLERSTFVFYRQAELIHYLKQSDVDAASLGTLDLVAVKPVEDVAAHIERLRVVPSDYTFIRA